MRTAQSGYFSGHLKGGGALLNQSTIVTIMFVYGLIFIVHNGSRLVVVSACNREMAIC